jgi:hypothetical protein
MFSIPKQTPAPQNDLELGKDFMKMLKNPLHALYFPANLLWKLARPLVGMSNKKVTDIPSHLANLAARGTINTVTYAKRMAIAGVFNAPVLANASGDGLTSPRKAGRDLKNSILNLERPSQDTSSTETA